MLKERKQHGRKKMKERKHTVIKKDRKIVRMSTSL